MSTGLLFLTSVSDTDPDQFVYKTLPPNVRVDKSTGVMMNSYLGLLPEVTVYMVLVIFFFFCEYIYPVFAIFIYFPPISNAFK